jgi:hypothetical protein|tara:strand:- start:191 stop:379 length:189 start_codon:yes stop_codon:yes gene_type:complete
MKKSSDFYLLKQKSLSEGDLFVVDYVRTKQTLDRMERQLEIMQLKLDSFLSEKKVSKLFDTE